MRKMVVIGAVVGVLMLLSIPNAAAFHGSPYTALGTATLAGKVFNAKLVWTGQGFGGQGTYRLEITEPTTGALIHKTSFAGRETFSNIRFVAEGGCGSVEIADYLGQAVAHPTVVFTITGFQKNNLCTGKAYMEYGGHYLNVFQLELVVWTAL